jgi:hypothetical protein
MADNSESVKSKYFLPQARLNKGQRKYCHCLMKSRPTKNKGAYLVCNIMSRRTLKNLPAGANPAQYKFNPRWTNCVVNYQYSDYSLAEVQAFCLEKGIPVTYNDIKTNARRPYRKDKLVEFLIKNYTKRHSKRT